MKRNIETPLVLMVLFLVSTVGVVDGAVNLISNPGFESGTTSWNFYTSGTGTFNTPSPSYEGTNAAKLTLSSSGGNIQLFQTGVALEANTRYRLSFAAYSNTGHDMTVGLIKHGAPYTPYMPDFTVNLGTSWQTFSIEFNTTGFSGTVNDGRLMFWLAPFVVAGDNYYIDALILEKVSVPPPPPGTIEARLAALETDMTALKAENTALKNLLAGVTRNGNDIYIDGANVHIRDGSGDTHGPVNGLGNLIIGYNELRSSNNDRTGSHNLIVGSNNNYKSYGGIVAGFLNEISGPYASISGGRENTASGDHSSVSGGWSNTASAPASSVSGGLDNTASGDHSSVCGGSRNTASGRWSSVSGGDLNVANGGDSSVSGGMWNGAFGDYSTVSGQGFITWPAAGSHRSAEDGITLPAVITHQSAEGEWERGGPEVNPFLLGTQPAVLLPQSAEELITQPAVSTPRSVEDGATQPAARTHQLAEDIKEMPRAYTTGWPAGYSRTSEN